MKLPLLLFTNFFLFAMQFTRIIGLQRKNIALRVRKSYFELVHARERFQQPSMGLTMLRDNLVRIPTANSMTPTAISRRNFSLRASSLESIMLPTSSGKKGTQFVFVGGKGGVGKTSSSSAIALSLSNQGFRTLIVSTDPAHSLGDALDVNLSSGMVTPIVTEQNLWALEVDVEDAVEKLRDLSANLDSASLASSLGIPKDFIDALGLEDLAGIFSNLPPGIDEIVSLSKIFEYANERLPNGNPRFDRVVIDTAPTGHTLRLLQLPSLLGSLTGNLIKFRNKLQSSLDMLKNMFGMGGGGGGSSGGPGGNLGTLNEMLDKLEDLQSRLSIMKTSLKDNDMTQFVVVTIPTVLAVTESKRLISDLQSQGISVSAIVCNQIVAEDAGLKYIETRRRGQQQCINSLINTVQSLDKIAADTAVNTGSPAPPPIEITQVNYVDTEVTGIYGLRYFANLAHVPKKGSATNPVDSRKLTIFGGKGGVGKTTTAASWAVRLADSGMRTLVVSTDPAHSLGDALQESLSGTPRLLDQTGGGGQLWAMEIDPDAALDEFRTMMKDALASDVPAGATSGASPMGALGDLKNELSSLLSSISDPPPGTDEVVALTKVVGYLEDGFTLPNNQVIKFDRIVLDTAPTGHTLRMLKLPTFLQGLVAKFKSVSKKAGALSNLMGGLGGMVGGGGGNIGNDRMQQSTQGGGKGGEMLDRFERRMKKLEDMLHTPSEAEFAIVTIPTELANAESKRLLTSLRVDDVAVRRVIINQVLDKFEAAAAGDTASASASASSNAPTSTPSSSPSPSLSSSSSSSSSVIADAYLDRLRKGQKASLDQLQIIAHTTSVPLIKVPYFDNEVRTVYGLRVIGNCIFPPKQ